MLPRPQHRRQLSKQKKLHNPEGIPRVSPLSLVIRRTLPVIFAHKAIFGLLDFRQDLPQ